MKKIFTTFILIISLHATRGQSLYFPPLTGDTWDTLSPARLGWCQSNIDSLYNYLSSANTDGFIVLKDGKIVLEKYFGNFTADSIHYWASAGKSLIAMLTGIAQEKGFVNINNPVSSYLGSGWTVAPTAKESAITLRHLLTMTSGLNDNPPSPCDNENTSASCLQYLTDTAQRWAYHTGAYQQLAAVISASSGKTINAFTNTYINNRTGMSGLWLQGVYYSKPRTMARYGLLALNRGVWGTDTLLRDTNYFKTMINTSQPLNKSYGYLWWLNGKPSFMAPGFQIVFPGNIIPNAPADMYCALGKNDQKIYVVPSQNMVIIRTGESAGTTMLALSSFDNQLWGKIDSLGIKCHYTFTGNGNWNIPANWKASDIPPTQLINSGIITITPAVNGECILNVPQYINQGTKLEIPANIRLRILGNLLINVN